MKLSIESFKAFLVILILVASINSGSCINPKCSGNRMRLFIEFFVADLNRSKAFYVNALGMRVTKDDPGHVQLVLGDAQINLCSITAISKGHYLFETSTQRIANRTEVCLEVDDLDKSFQRAKEAGANILEPIKVQSWGMTDFRMADPDGVYLRITTPVIKPMSVP